MAELDDKGRCCGRKPIVYKLSPAAGEPPQRFCHRCNRAYHLTDNRQIENWCWMETTKNDWPSERRWRLQRDEHGEIVMLHKCNHEGHWIRYTPDGEALPLARLAAAEERQRLLDYMRTEANRWRTPGNRSGEDRLTIKSDWPSDWKEQARALGAGEIVAFAESDFFRVRVKLIAAERMLIDTAIKSSAVLSNTASDSNALFLAALDLERAVVSVVSLREQKKATEEQELEGWTDPDDWKPAEVGEMPGGVRGGESQEGPKK